MSHHSKHKAQPAKPTGISAEDLSEVSTDFLDSLDLDLSDLLSQAEINQSIRQTAKEKKVKHKAKQTSSEAVEHAPKPSPWRATKSILLMQETQCRCGATFLHPAAKLPLAHFAHIHKPDTIWEVASHPSVLNKDLPKETRILIDLVEACPECFEDQS